ncbi:MAG: response regulator [Syntrophaceae bacterium]|jgi:DNA-binding response OmpR family regulator|nr:response regulator [Syntrophaceae bacterium]
MKRILVIDDDDALRNMLKKLFTSGGFDVLTAQNGEEALLLQAQRPADLVVTDLIMPNKEGIETIIEFRKQYPFAIIIAMSGGGRIPAAQYLELAQNLGARKTFEKPFKTGEILAAVKELLEE